MNSLAKKLQISWLDPLLFDVNTGIVEGSLKGGVRKRRTALQPEVFKTRFVSMPRRKCRITTIMRQEGELNFALFELFKEVDLINFEYSNKRRTTHETFKRPMFRIKLVSNKFCYALHVLT